MLAGIAAFLLASLGLLYYALRGDSYDLVVRNEEAIAVGVVLGLGCLLGLLPRARLPGGSWVPLALSRIKGVADPVGTPAAPSRPGTPAAPPVPAAPAASESGPTVGGGFVAAIVAAAVVLAALAFLARRRRGSAP